MGAQIEDVQVRVASPSARNKREFLPVWGQCPLIVIRRVIRQLLEFGTVDAHAKNIRRARALRGKHNPLPVRTERRIVIETAFVRREERPLFRTIALRDEQPRRRRPNSVHQDVLRGVRARKDRT